MKGKGGPSCSSGSPLWGKGREEGGNELHKTGLGPSWREMTINNSAPEITFLALINQEPLQPALPSLLNSRFRAAVGAQGWGSCLCSAGDLLCDPLWTSGWSQWTSHWQTEPYTLSTKRRSLRGSP